MIQDTLCRQEVAVHVRGGKVLESAFLPCSLSQGVISPHFLIRPTLPLSPSWPNHVQEKVRSNVVGLKLLGEKSKTFPRLAEEEEGAGKTVQVCARGSSSCSRFRALSLPRQRQGSESQPGCLRLSQGVEEACGHRSQDGVKGRPQGQVTVVEHQANSNTSRDYV